MHIFILSIYPVLKLLLIFLPLFCILFFTQHCWRWWPEQLSQFLLQWINLNTMSKETMDLYTTSLCASGKASNNSDLVLVCVNILFACLYPLVQQYSTLTISVTLHRRLSHHHMWWRIVTCFIRNLWVCALASYKMVRVWWNLLIIVAKLSVAITEYAYFLENILLLNIA